MTAYQKLEARCKRQSAIANALGILHWDKETMMPDAAAPARGEVLAELIEHATGAPLGTEAYKMNIRARYLG